MDYGWIAAAITATVGVFALFFGKSHWAMLNTLVENQTSRIDQLRVDNQVLQKRIDQVEHDYYQAVNHGEYIANAMDNYVSMLTAAMSDNKRLREDNEKLIYRLDALNPLPSPSADNPVEVGQNAG